VANNWIVPNYVSAQAPDSMKVLILNSYHQGYQWTDEIMEGIKSEFDNTDMIVELFIEYMDTKHYHSQEYFLMMRKLYLFKYQNTAFDLIIVSDNYALEFLKSYYDQIFPSVPIVFCGVDHFSDAMIADLPEITGVVEDYDLEETIDLALQLHPETKHIAVVSDSSIIGRIDHKRFRKIAPKYKNDFQIFEIVNWNIKELAEELNNLPEHTIVFRLSFSHSWKSHFIPNEEIAPFWERYCASPTYTSMGHQVENGVIGGIINTGDLHGATAARMARRILQGESASDIPVILDSPSVPVFDYVQMRRFGIKESDLPTDTIIINRPFSFYAKYKYLVWVVIVVFSSLSLLIVILFINIINRRKAERALAENEKKYRILIETVPHGILEIDVLGKITFANSALQKMLKYEEDELTGMSVFDFVPSKQRVKTREVIQRAIRNNTTPTQSMDRYATKDGNLIDAQLDWNYKRDVDGKINGIISVVSNITERLQAEKQAKLRQEQLIQADKMAALGTLVAGVAHEVNNPNNFIMLNIPIIKRAWKSITPILNDYYEKNGEFNIAGFSYSQMTEEFPQICSDILDGSQRIKSIVTDLKEYSRTSEIDKFEQVDINEMTSSSINLLSNNIKKYTDRFEINYGKNIPLVKGNFQHFEQVLINLIQNSCQAIPDRDKGIYVTTFFNKPKNTVDIEIKDEGVGIPKEDLPRIFDPFFTTKRETGGMGLGLSVSHSIIQKYNGRMQYSSKPGRGTVAKIILPVEDHRK